VSERTTYSDAGVDIDEARRAVALIKRSTSKTFTPEVLTSIGALGSGFSLKVFVIPARKFGFVSQTLKKLGEVFYRIGRIVETSSNTPGVIYL
jgi:phosphoribosylaminoimidazole (AIR) synthetase